MRKLDKHEFLESISYSLTDQILRVKMKGKVGHYDYLNVSLDDSQDLMYSADPGKTLNTLIKPNYVCKGTTYQVVV